MAAGKLSEPKVITDFNHRVVCTLPIGFYFDDVRRERIRQRYDEKGDMPGMADLKELLSDEPTMQNTAVDTGETFGGCSD